jgi:hypothetical protein
LLFHFAKGRFYRESLFKDIERRRRFSVLLETLHELEPEENRSSRLTAFGECE